MSGLIYKNFRLNRASFIFSLANTALCCLTLILLCFFAGGDLTKDPERSGGTVFVFALIYYLAFMISSMTTSNLFQSDESRVCTSFAISLPQGAKGHIHAKYYCILAENVIILFLLFICDTVCTAMLGGKFSGIDILLIIFCWRMLLLAVEMPFIIRFGSQRGLNIKGAVVGILFSLILIYFLFGDISWLDDSDDPIMALMEWIQSGDIIFWVSLFPYFSVAAYYLSCRISVGVYRKGAESYEQ